MGSSAEDASHRAAEADRAAESGRGVDAAAIQINQIASQVESTAEQIQTCRSRSARSTPSPW